ncbi:adenosylcobinamide-GDP ribazoletransferase [Paenibacillus sp. MSJ-34]|uniref:adenosylcobinamide-GDP ribazoletransferase n=1 Tax=Paenibacillus sp. MSJ-34 TaxID=2841529 RepID=UPI001C12615A|nr:adenosylcobinamide-GDP ribazoletransferase [Paenibacillus sp. MSJ-34]MBU5443859.1 adenosylcobinamide-GDP ribazoletransferase [Paenibacillus sp. MSJ-34]
MKRQWEALAAAFQFLSRIPFPVRVNYTKEVFVRSVAFYPLVGAALGGLLYAAGFAAGFAVPPALAAALSLAFAVMLTGALHLDGLMDTADGLLSHRPREQMLDIMKDSRVGAMGVIVCVLTLMIKGAAIYTLLEQGHWLWYVALPFVWSRWFMVVAIVRWPYARQDSGLGSYFKQAGARHAAAATATAAAVSIVIAALGLWAGSGGSGEPIRPIEPAMPLLMGAGALLLGWLAASYIARKLGGLTGDTYGALNEWLETALLVALAVIGHQFAL